MDTLSEIAANKICALLDRIEVRDLVDLRLLLGSGLTLSNALLDAQKKHAGVDAATLAWVLSESKIPKTAPIPPGTTAKELDAFREELIATLTRSALPDE